MGKGRGLKDHVTYSPLIKSPNGLYITPPPPPLVSLGVRFWHLLQALAGSCPPFPTGSDVIRATCASGLFISAPKARMKEVHG